MKVHLRIESIVHGGEGLARADGRVVFVPGGAPGDLVEAELPDGERGSFGRGKLLRVLAGGPARVAPPCPVIDRCGGCPVQHLAQPAQLEAKGALVADALARIGGFPAGSVEIAPIVASPKQLQYRRRARLHRAAAGRWGFAGRASSEVVAVEECLLFEPALQQLADRVRGAADALGGLPGVVDLGLDTSDAGHGSVDLRTEKPPTPALRKKAEALLKAVPKVRGITLGVEGGPELVGDPVVADAPDAKTGARFRTRADLFAQANRSAAPLLVQAALDGLGEAARGSVLELFCGSGTFTLPLLATARAVVGVEGAAASLALLRKSAAEAGLVRRAQLQLVAGDVAQVLAGSAHPRFDAVLMDPPRTGAANVLRPLAALGAPRVVYVSCDAPTFARDAKALAGLGYRLERVVPFDLFPQTAHMELVGTFTRGA